jgi:hypothetical protein
VYRALTHSLQHRPFRTQKYVLIFVLPNFFKNLYFYNLYYKNPLPLLSIYHVYLTIFIKTMQSIKFAFGIFASAALLTLAACTPTPTPEPDPTPTPTNNCAIESQKDGALDVVKVTYDAQHRILKQSFYDVNGVLTSTSEYEYAADGKINKKINRDASAVSTGFSLYEYNAAGKLTFEKKYDAFGALAAQYEYIYNGSAQLSRKNEFYRSGSGNIITAGDYYTYQYSSGTKPSTVNAYFTPSSFSQRPTRTDYTYDANDNITNEASYFANASQTYTVVRTFDSKRNALISFTGLMPTAVTGTVAPNGVAGKNNVLTEIKTYYASGSGTQPTVVQTTYSYQFDAKGNPTQQAVRPTSGAAKDYVFGFHCH